MPLRYDDHRYHSVRHQAAAVLNGLVAKRGATTTPDAQEAA